MHSPSVIAPIFCYAVIDSTLTGLVDLNWTGSLRLYPNDRRYARHTIVFCLIFGIRDRPSEHSWDDSGWSLPWRLQSAFTPSSDSGRVEHEQGIHFFSCGVVAPEGGGT